MKKALLVSAILLTTFAAWAQVPQQISYQSVIRDGDNKVIASSTVGIKIFFLGKSLKLRLQLMLYSKWQYHQYLR